MSRQEQVTTPKVVRLYLQYKQINIKSPSSRLETFPLV